MTGLPLVANAPPLLGAPSPVSPWVQVLHDSVLLSERRSPVDTCVLLLEVAHPPTVEQCCIIGCSEVPVLRLGLLADGALCPSARLREWASCVSLCV